MKINGVAHTFLTVSDFDRARAFYSQLLPFLGMKPVMDIAGTYYCVGGRTAFGIREAPEDKRAEGSDPGWTLMIAKRPDRQRDPAGHQDQAADDAPPAATADTGQANVAAPRQSRTAQVVPRDRARQGPIERSQAARADGSLPFDDEIGF